MTKKNNENNNEIRKDKFIWEEGDVLVIMPDDPRYEEYNTPSFEPREDDKENK